jgi:hypothetical protein
MGWFTNLVSDLTGDSTSKASEAGHTARDDGDFRESDHGDKHFQSAPDWADRSTDCGVDLFPDGK